MADLDDIECTFVEESGLAHYEYMMSPSELEGPLENVVAYLSKFLAPTRQNVRIDHETDHYGSGEWLYVRWDRQLQPEEIARRERVEREASARHAADAAARERQEYERLKAKYGSDPLQDRDAENADR